MTAPLEEVRSARVWSRTAAVFLIAAPLLLGAGLALTPYGSEDAAGHLQFDVILADRGRLVWVHVLAIPGLVFLLGSVLALCAVFTERLPRTAVSAAVLTAFGIAGMLIFATLDVYKVGMVSTGADEAMDLLFTRLDDAPAIVPHAGWLFPLYLVGTVVLTVGLWRSGLVPKWVALACGLGGMFPAVPNTGLVALLIPIVGLRLAGSLWVVRHILAPLGRGEEETMTPAPVTANLGVRHEG